MAQERSQIDETRAREMSHGRRAIDTEYVADDRSSDEIRRDLERTREEMTGTVHELEEKLSPKRWVNDAIDSLRDEANRSRVLETIRDNPLPALMIAAGATWLLVDTMTDRRRRHEEYDYEPSYDVEHQLPPPGGQPAYAMTGVSVPPEAGIDEDESTGDKIRGAAHTGKAKAGELAGRARESMEHAGDKASHMAHRAKDKLEHMGDKASHMAHRAREKAEHAGHRASHMAHEAGRKASHMAHGARDRAAEAGHAVKHGAIRAGERMSDLFDEHPLVVGAMAAVGGLIAGMLLPKSRREREILGPARDEMLHEAKEKAVDLADRTVEVGKAAADAAHDEAERQDLTPHDLKEKAAAVADRAKEAAKDEAEKQDLTAEHVAKEAKETAREAGNKASDQAKMKVNEKREPKNI